MLKSTIKSILYYSGLLAFFHRLRNRNLLTVVLFHRVLPMIDPRWKCADMNWTVSEQFFTSCIEFFIKHYNIVTIEKVTSALEKGTKLPSRPLLITFDDGWSDNEEFAAEILKKYNIKALLFVTPSAINTHILSWQEALYCTCKSNILTNSFIKKIAELIGSTCTATTLDWQDESYIFQLIKEIKEIKKTKQPEYRKVTSKIFKYAKKIPVPDQMITSEQLKKLSNNIMDIGTHGLHHEPINECSKPMEELYGSIEQLENLCSLPYKITSMSFPHGRCDKQTILLAIQCGYKVICGGWPVLNNLPFKGQVALLGRLNICQKKLSDNNGKLKEDLLALYLFRQPHKQIEQN